MSEPLFVCREAALDQSFVNKENEQDWNRCIRKTREVQPYTCVYPDRSVRTVTYSEVSAANWEETERWIEIVLSDEDASPEERIESIAHWIEAYQGFMRWLAPRAGITIAYDAHAGRYIDYAKYLRAHGWSDERAEEYAVKRDAELFGA